MTNDHDTKDDCTFLYFKPAGKWKYEGRGRFPRPIVDGEYYAVDRQAIVRANGSMPGIISDAMDMVVVVIPDDECTVRTAYPRMLNARP